MNHALGRCFCGAVSLPFEFRLRDTKIRCGEHGQWPHCRASVRCARRSLAAVPGPEFLLAGIGSSVGQAKGRAGLSPMAVPRYSMSRPSMLTSDHAPESARATQSHHEPVRRGPKVCASKGGAASDAMSRTDNLKTMVDGNAFQSLRDGPVSCSIPLADDRQSPSTATGPRRLHPHMTAKGRRERLGGDVGQTRISS